MVVARYAPNGRLNTEFGVNGLIDVTEYSSSRGNAITTDKAGNILIAGHARTATSGSNFDFTLRRYDAMGNPVGFSALEEALFPITDFEGKYDSPLAILVQEDGKIVLAGGSQNSSHDFALARYRTDGLLDPDFGVDGRLSTDVSKQNLADSVNAIAIQPDGKLIVAGFSAVSTTNTRLALARYLPNGVLDTTFGGDGIVTTNISDGRDNVQAIALRPDGSIVVGGTAGKGEERQFVVAQYTADGKLDVEFGPDKNGLAFTDFDLEAIGTDMHIEPDGFIMMAGCMQDAVDSFAFARFSPSGFLDESFSDDGHATIDMNSVEGACAHAVARQGASDDYIAVGTADVALLDGQFALANIFINTPPVVEPESYAVLIDTPLNVLAPGVLSNDYDIDEHELAATLLVQPRHGILNFSSDGSFSYTPNEGYTGQDSFTYSVDDRIELSAPTTVTITVVPEPAQPIIGLAAESSSPTLLNSPTVFTATLQAGDDVTYSWDFGDGNSGNGASTSHTYASAGSYIATVTATNSVSSETAAITVVVRRPDDPTDPINKLDKHIFLPLIRR